jgi:NADPH2:quinone reductase
VDYVCEPPVEAALQAASDGGRFVQIGEAAWHESRQAALVLRSKALSLFGFGKMSVSKETRAAAYQRICHLAAQGQLTVPVERLPLSQVTQAWERQRAGTRQRLVLLP